MKKIIFALVVLLLAAPVWAADVDITAVADGNVVTVSYNASGAPNDVRAFALDITLESDTATIVDVNCADNADYYIYPGKIEIDGDDIDYGDCLCDFKALGGEDTNGVTVEMASLYVGEGNDPGPTGVLLTFVVVGCDDANVVINTNAIRGGVVLEDPALEAGVDFTLSMTGCTVVLDSCYDGCLPLDDPAWANWDEVGRPGSWCCAYQNMGDTNGDGCINIQDLMQTFKPAYGKCYPDAAYNPDADTNQDKCVNIQDLMQNFKPNYGTCPQSGYDCEFD